MVVQYEYNGFEGCMTQKDSGGWIPSDDYWTLKETFDDFLKEASRVHWDLAQASKLGEVTDAAYRLQAAVTAATAVIRRET